jgi:hypothetical protein
MSIVHRTILQNFSDSTTAMKEDAMNKGLKARAPMLLPWLARKAGISEHRAEILWGAALRHAALRCEAETPAYWKAAMDRLLELVTAESLREDAASFGWRSWSRAQARFWTTPVETLDEFTLAAVRNWRVLGEKLAGHFPRCC